MSRRRLSWPIVISSIGLMCFLDVSPSGAAGPQAPRFAAARGYAVPAVPITVNIADMTGDGRPDIVAAGQGTVVSLLQNRGGRLFARAVNVSMGGDANFLGGAGVADLNADGFPDVASAAFNEGTGAGTISVLINDNGHGFLDPALYVLTQASEEIAIGDVDGDGDPDLVVTVENFHTGQSGIGVMANAGNGTFGSPVYFTEPKISGTSALVDLNGDGLNDLAVLDLRDSVLGVLLGDGQGSFGVEAIYSLRTLPVSFALGDMNNDGSPDAIVGGARGDGTFLPNNGDGTFGQAVPVNLGVGVGPAWVAVDDLDGDGNLDIAVDGGWVTPEFGRGDGTFRRGGRFGAGGSPGILAAGDLDRDGKQDLAVIGAFGTVTTLFGSSGGRFQAAYPLVVSPISLDIGAFAVTDLSGDGLPDLAFGGGTGGTQHHSVPSLIPRLLVTLNLGGGRFGPPTTYELPWDPTGIATADFNGDGVLDLGVSLGNNDIENLAVLLGTGGGGFGAPSLSSVTNYAAGVAAGDFTGDGKLDVALAVFNSGLVTVDVFVLPGNGDGTFGPEEQTTLANADPFGIVAADFNADTIPDVGLIVHRDDLTDRVLAVTALGNGDGTFAGVQQYGLGKGFGGLASADLNGDGVTDLVGSAPNSGRVVPLLGAGDGTFVPQPALTVGTRPHWLVIADFTADGVPDLAIADEAALLWPLPGFGDGTFGGGIAYAASTGPLGAADLDGNGTLDIAESQTFNPIVTLYFGLPH